MVCLLQMTDCSTNEEHSARDITRRRQYVRKDAVCPPLCFKVGDGKVSDDVYS